MKMSAWIGLASLCTMLGSAALAQEPQPPPPPPKPSYKSILDQGFEVKSVVFIPSDASTRLAQSVQPDTVMVTLQKQTMTAVCWITLSAWNSQAVGDLPCTVLQ